MVKLSVAKKWGFKEFKYLCEDTSDSSRITKMKCQVCCEFYGEKPEQLEKLQGQVKTFVKRWVQGSEVIKKKMLKTILKVTSTPLQSGNLERKRTLQLVIRFQLHLLLEIKKKQLNMLGVFQKLKMLNW